MRKFTNHCCWCLKCFDSTGQLNQHDGPSAYCNEHRELPKPWSSSSHKADHYPILKMGDCSKCDGAFMHAPDCKLFPAQKKVTTPDYKKLAEDLAGALLQAVEPLHDAHMELQALAENAGWSDKEAVLAHCVHGKNNIKKALSNYRKATGEK